PRVAPGLSLPVPVASFAFSGEGSDPAFALHPMLAGPALTRERYLALEEPARDRCAHAVGRFLAELHATDLTLPRACGIPEIDYRVRYQALRERARTALSDAYSREIDPWLEQVIGEFPATAVAAPDRSVLLHGDLSPDHVLYDSTRAEVTGIIDFGDLAIGDPAWDLVYVCEDYGLDFLKRLLAVYPAKDL